MIDINLIRNNKELVKENIKKKFQNDKLILVDKIYDLDLKFREFKQKGDTLRSEKNTLSSKIGLLMREGKKEEAESTKKKVSQINDEISLCEKEEESLEQEIKEKMMVIPNIIDSSVPIGKDDSCNVEKERFGKAYVPKYEIPYLSYNL